MVPEGSGSDATHFDVQVVVKLESLPEEQDELEEIGELPHVPDAMQHGRFRRPLGIVQVELLRGALASSRHLGLSVLSSSTGSSRDARVRRNGCGSGEDLELTGWQKLANGRNPHRRTRALERIQRKWAATMGCRFVPRRTFGGGIWSDDATPADRVGSWLGMEGRVQTKRGAGR
jgi:hypothetical protein